MKLKNILIPLILFGLTFTLRLYKLSSALGDWHSWRQADTASVAREYVKNGIDLLHPKYMDLSSIPSGKENPEGYRMVEFPIVNAVHAYLASSFPGLGLVEWGRLLSIFASSCSVVFLYLIVKQISGTRPAFLTGLVYAVLPYSVYYGRVILPEPHLVLFMLSSLWFFIKYWDSNRLWYYALTLLSLTLAILMKPTALVILLPMAGYSLALGITTKKLIAALAIPALAVLPYLSWRNYIQAYPAGIPASEWLFNGNNIRFKGAWFHWLFGDRLGRLILGYWGLIPFGLGLVSLGKKKKEVLVYGGLLLGSLSYISVVATGNVQHDYYQVLIMPAVAVMTGLGFSYLLGLGKGLKKLYLTALAGFIFVLMLALAWYEVRGFFWVNNGAMVEAGQEVDKLAGQDVLVIAPYMGDTAFLFQTNRRGWPIGGDIENKIKAGARYYVTTTRDDEYRELLKKYTLVKETANYSIIKLTK